MSTKNNALLAAAAAALGVTLTAGEKPLVVGMLNDLNITAMGAVEVNAAGKSIVIVSVLSADGLTTAIRPVADTSGSVKVFVDGAAVVALAKNANLAAGVKVQYVKAIATKTIGDPIAALKSKYKRFKAEALSSVKNLDKVTINKNAAVALGWDLATGTPENAEYLDLVDRLASINEWKAFNESQVVSLAASLTAAGIDPVTVV